MPSHDTIAILDYGSQTAQLIARRVRELHVYCELIPWNAPAERFAALDPQGYILSGGPASVYEPGAPALPPFVLASGKPVLGICYGMQLLANALGGQVDPTSAPRIRPGSYRANGYRQPTFLKSQASSFQLPAHRLDEPRRPRNRPAADLCTARAHPVLGRGDG